MLSILKHDIFIEFNQYSGALYIHKFIGNEVKCKRLISIKYKTFAITFLRFSLYDILN